MLERKYNQYRNLTKRITKGDERHEDLLHDILIQLSTNEKWNNLQTDQERLYFLTRTITNQYYSNNSKFHRTYRNQNKELYDIPDTQDEDYQDRPSVEWLNNLLTKELESNPDNWYNVGLFRLFIKDKRIDEIHKQTLIPKYSIRETIKFMKGWVQQKWIEQCQR